MSAGESSIAFARGEGTPTLQDRSLRLFIVLSSFFCVNAALAEFIGVKIFALEDTLGIAPLQWNLFGQTGSLNFTAGTLLWPIVFLMTDVINEFFGRRGVRLISWLAAILIAYGFVFAFAAIALAPAEWWVKAAQPHRVSISRSRAADRSRSARAWSSSQSKITL